MPRTEEQNQLIKDRRRSKITRSAARVFAIEGYDKTAVDNITKEVHCSHGLFYHYFENKADLLEAIVEEDIKNTDIVPPCREALNEGGVKGIKTIVNYLNIAFNSSSQRLPAAILAYRLASFESAPKSVAKFAADHDVRKTLKTLIEQGQAEKKVIAGDANEIANAAIAVIEANFNYLIVPGKRDPLVSADVLYNLLLLGERED